MNTDLMGSSGVENRFDESRSIQAFKHSVRSAGGPAHIFIHGHPFAVRGMPRNGGANFTAVPLNLATDNRVISLIDTSTSELSGKRDVSVIVLRDDQTTASVFIEAVHNAWPGDTADAAQLSPTMM